MGGDAERGGDRNKANRLFGAARGAPERPLIEAIALLAAFYLAAFIPLIPSIPLGLAKAPYHLEVIATNAPRILLILVIMASGDGLSAFGIGRLTLQVWPRAALCALGALVVALAPAFALGALGWKNPVMEAVRQGPRAGFGLVPLVMLSSLAVGYCEELVFRAYLLRRLGQIGLPATWAAVVSSLLFGAGHGYQGIVGLVSGFALGLYFAWRWEADRNIHEIALGHAAYDAAVTAFAIFS